MMQFRGFYIGAMLLCGALAVTAGVDGVINTALTGLDARISEDPYNRAIERMYIGYDETMNARVGIAHREIESFKPITGVVIVHKTNDGFVLHEALFPDVDKIRNAKDRKEVLTVLQQFKNVPFDPYAEKSAVDGLTGATRYGLKTSGYLNYMARRIALEMESQPDWPKK